MVHLAVSVDPRLHPRKFLHFEHLPLEWARLLLPELASGRGRTSLTRLRKTLPDLFLNEKL